MRSRLLAAICVIAIGCGPATPSTGPGGSGSPAGLPTLSPPPIDLAGVPARVHVEAAKGTAAWIGPAGGTLTATAEDGTAYQLEIPEYAVFQPTPITMTPISALDGLGLSGGLAGAVYLQPSGLELAVPATLRFTTSRTAPAGTRLVGFDAPDDGAAAELVPATGSGSEVTVAVFHFSAPGAAYGSSADLAQFNVAGQPTSLSALLTTILAYALPWDSTDAIAAGLFIDAGWAGSPLQPAGTTGLRAAMTAASTDAQLLKVVKDWRTFILLLNLWAVSGDVAAALAAGDQYQGGARASHTAAYLDGQGLLGDELRQAIDGNEALCNQTHDLDALANMWFWAGIGERYSPGAADWPALAAGCANLVAAPFNPPAGLQAGGSDSFTLAMNLEFGDGARVPAGVDATLQGSGFTFAATGSGTMAAAIAAGTTRTESVTATQAPPYSLGVTACWVLNGLRRNLCATIGLPFGQAASAAPSGPGGPSGPGVLDISGSYELGGSYQSRCGAGVSVTGTGKATQSGSSVSIDWSIASISLPASPEECFTKEFNSLFQASYAITGTLSGSVTTGFEVVGFSWPCGNFRVPVGVSTQVAIRVPAPCGTSGMTVQITLRRTGP